MGAKNLDVVITVIVVILVVLVWIMLYDSNRFVVRHYFLRDQRIKKPVKAVVLADLHNKRYGKENERLLESIKNQQDFLLRYAAEQGYEVAEIYADDGWSGTNFDRPAFQRMIRDIEEKKINLVLTKDLSRLGRDYILTGHYLERYFPEHQIRYIAVNDGIDTFENSIANELNPFKAVMNDMYARDISNKVRTALTTKKQNGKFIGAFAPFGYQKSAEDKNKLEVDPLTAPTVKRIFQLFLSGESMKRIAQRLTQEGVLTPSKQRQAQRGADRWNDVMIKRILTNETYIGNLTQNRTRKINYKL